MARSFQDVDLLPEIVHLDAVRGRVARELGLLTGPVPYERVVAMQVAAFREA
jgi:hypothetical protein